MATPMTAAELLDETALLQRIGEQQRRLDDLNGELQAVNAELESLGEQRATWEMLEQVLGSLEQLESAGAGHLFWGNEAQGRTEEHVRAARDRADDHLGRIGEVERRRSGITQEILRNEDVLDLLETDLYELRLEEELRLQEWELERELVESVRPVIMPWSGMLEEQQRLRKSLSISLLVALVLGAVIPFIDLPLPDLELIPEVPERFANLIEREPPPPPPPPVVEPAEPEIVPDEPLVVEELPEEVIEAPVEPTPAVAEEPAPEQQVRSAGILAFRESIASIERRDLSELGAQARINNAGEAAVGRTERSMVTSQAPGSSGGINLASLSRDVGGGGAGEGLDGVEVTRVASSIGVSGNGDRPMAAGATAGRTDEEIQIVFDRYKSALYRLYNLELRNDPTLRGQIVLRLTIEADGSVSFCEVQASDMGAAVLEQQIVDRVLTFDFGAKEGIAAITILYPIDFLPAG